MELFHYYALVAGEPEMSEDCAMQTLQMMQT